ncbi:MAG: TMEM175 family protein [Rudaea sp.]
MTHHPRTDAYGFRLRGGENTRIEAFTDAAFAFAVTLLMIGGGHVPTDVTELLGALQGLPGYALSFVLLCVFWYAHYDWYRHFGIEDGRSIVFSLLLVFLVLIFVYPLHMMFDAVILIGSRSAAGSVHIRTWHDWRVVYVVFGIAFASMSAVIAILYAHAWRQRKELELNAAEMLITRSALWRWCTSVSVSLLSALTALSIPATAPAIVYALPGFTYWLLGLSGRIRRLSLRRRLAALARQA